MRFWLALAVLLASAVTQAADPGDSAAFTDLDTIANAAFPTSTMVGMRLAKPSEREMKAIAFARDAIARQFTAAGPSWFRPVSEPFRGGEIDFRRTIDALKRVPFWVCGSNCTVCRRPACLQTKLYGDTLAAVITVNACTLSPYPRACKGVNPNLDQPNVQLLFNGLRGAMNEVAYLKFHPQPDLAVKTAALKRAETALAESTRTMTAIADSCPGPYSERAYAFLAGNGHLKPIGGLSDDCARKYLAPLKSKALPPACKQLVDSKRWEAQLAKGVLGNEPSAVRCDDLCEALTCGERDAPRVRAMQMGRRWLLSIPEGACEGTIPTRPRELAQDMVRLASRPDMLRLSSAQALLETCARALVPQVDKPPSQQGGGGTMDAGTGPTIDLIE